MHERILEEIKNLGNQLKFLIEKSEQYNCPAVVVPIPEDELINVHMAAKLMGVSPKTAERRGKNGIINYKKIGGLGYYSRNEVTALAKTM